MLGAKKSKRGKYNMKQRLCGKIIKHKERYSGVQIQKAYERSVRSLRKYYKKLYENDETWMKNLYMHKACQPFFIMTGEVDELWCVKEREFYI